MLRLGRRTSGPRVSGFGMADKFLLDCILHAIHLAGEDMGYNPGMLDLFVEWANKFQIRSGAAVLDIGTSELFCADDPDSLNRFLVHFGAKPYADDELHRMAERTFAADLFLRAGLAYQAIDITPYPHTLPLDLNADSLPFWRRGRYSLVTNCGTTEHVFNQYNAFKLIHDATAVGGLMYHGVPMSGEFGHGFISYNPKFFTRLAEVNGYEIVRLWGWASEEARPHEETEKIPFNCPFASQDAYVHVLLRRSSKGRFRGPSDCIGWPPAP
jgi:hypothetical protein